MAEVEVSEELREALDIYVERGIIAAWMSTLPNHITVEGIVPFPDLCRYLEKLGWGFAWKNGHHVAGDRRCGFVPFGYKLVGKGDGQTVEKVEAP